MGRTLIVANQTLGGPELDNAIRDRIERGAAVFFVLVPVTAPQEEAPAWRRGFEIGTSESVSRLGGVALREEDASSPRATHDQEEYARGREALLEEARERAEQRLGQMLDRIRSAGGEAEGDVGDSDPAVAVGQLLGDQSFDEIIISTLPPGISRWLRMDVSSRVSRMTDAPVTTVEADSEE